MYNWYLERENPWDNFKSDILHAKHLNIDIEFTIVIYGWFIVIDLIESNIALSLT